LICNSADTERTSSYEREIEEKLFIVRKNSSRYTGRMKLQQLRNHHPKIHLSHGTTLAVRMTILIVGFIMIATWFVDNQEKLKQAVIQHRRDTGRLEKQLRDVALELETLRNEDQFRKNALLSDDIRNIEATYRKAVSVYEDLLSLQDITKNTTKQEEAFSDILTLLSKRDYRAASTKLTALSSDIATVREEIANAFVIPQNVPVNNAPPGSGYSRQQVTTDAGTFLVDIVSGDLGSTRVIVDTAAASDCFNDCPVLPLSDYVSRNGAYAGVNGSYFCPASYPSCADKKNTFDTLLMNKNKVYFNSDNNVYSTVPAVIFLGSSVRFVGRSLEWGRDTSPDGVIANQPLLVSGGTVVFGGDDDPKKGSRGGRSFVANRGSVVFIGVVHNATVAQAALVMKALGMDNALNLDDGGSTALWHGGYKAGPGRNIPNAILFIRK